MLLLLIVALCLGAQSFSRPVVPTFCVIESCDRSVVTHRFCRLYEAGRLVRCSPAQRVEQAWRRWPVAAALSAAGLFELNCQKQYCQIGGEFSPQKHTRPTFFPAVLWFQLNAGDVPKPYPPMTATNGGGFDSREPSLVARGRCRQIVNGIPAWAMINDKRMLAGGTYDPDLPTFAFPEQFEQWRALAQDEMYRGRDKQRWIVKPALGGRGAGIQILDTTAVLAQGDQFDPSSVQPLLTRPVLVDGCKFSLRVYVLLFDDGSLFWYRPYALVKLAAKPFAGAHDEDRAHVVTLDSAKVSRRPLHTLDMAADLERPGRAALIDSFQYLLREKLPAPSADARRCSFWFLGVDIDYTLPDDPKSEYRAHVIDINQNPSIIDEPDGLMRRTLADVFQFVGLLDHEQLPDVPVDRDQAIRANFDQLLWAASAT